MGREERDSRGEDWAHHNAEQRKGGPLSKEEVDRLERRPSADKRAAERAARRWENRVKKRNTGGPSF